MKTFNQSVSILWKYNFNILAIKFVANEAYINFDITRVGHSQHKHCICAYTHIHIDTHARIHVQLKSALPSIAR